MRVFSSLLGVMCSSLMALGFEAQASQAVIKDGTGNKEIVSHRITKLEFARSGVQVFSENRVVCLIDAAFLNANGMNGWQVASILVETPWEIECLVDSTLEEGALIQRMYYRPI